MIEYDEIVLLDWDTVQIKPIPEDFWDVLAQKAPIQAVLRVYFRLKATQWRKIDQQG